METLSGIMSHMSNDVEESRGAISVTPSDHSFFNEYLRGDFFAHQGLS